MSEEDNENSSSSFSDYVNIFGDVSLGSLADTMKATAASSMAEAGDSTAMEDYIAPLPKNNNNNFQRGNIQDVINSGQNFMSGNVNVNYFLSKMCHAESGGNAKAKNPNGSAYGPYQIIKDTWRAYCKRMGVNYSLEDRADFVKSTNVARYMVNDYIKSLQGSNLPVNYATLYLCHFLGVGGAKAALKAGSNASIASVLNKQAININAVYTKRKDGSVRTVGEVLSILGSKF